MIVLEVSEAQYHMKILLELTSPTGIQKRWGIPLQPVSVRSSSTTPLSIVEFFRLYRYGMVVLIAFYAFPMQFIAAEKPDYFVFALLAMNGTGTIVVTEYISIMYLQRTNFDTPPYRVAKALTALTTSIAVVAVFQFAFWNPARRQIRMALAR